MWRFLTRARYWGKIRTLFDAHAEQEYQRQEMVASLWDTWLLLPLARTRHVRLVRRLASDSRI